MLAGLRVKNPESVDPFVSIHFGFGIKNLLKDITEDNTKKFQDQEMDNVQGKKYTNLISYSFRFLCTPFLASNDNS